MILLEIKKYIKQHHEVALSDITNHFDLTEDSAHGMLLRLLNQGHVQRINSEQCATGQCSTGCSQAKQGERYFWRDKCLVSLSIPVQVR